jgi:hypothetical protein
VGTGCTGGHSPALTRGAAPHLEGLGAAPRHLPLRAAVCGSRTDSLRGCEALSCARRASRPHDVLPHPRQGAISRGGRRGGRELANRGAVVNAVASRRFFSKRSRALARERERGGRKRGRRVEPRTDHADLTRCPTTVATQRSCPSSNARVHCKAHAVIRCRSWRQRANDRTMRELESPEKHLRRQAAHAMTIIGV